MDSSKGWSFFRRSSSDDNCIKCDQLKFILHEFNDITCTTGRVVCAKFELWSCDRNEAIFVLVLFKGAFTDNTASFVGYQCY